MLIIIDDDELFRSALAANLHDDGYEVAAYPTGAMVPPESLEDAEGLLTTYGRGGLALAERFHERCPSVPVVVLAGAADAIEREVANSDYLRVLHKPLAYEHLLDVLQRSSRDS